jgi:Deacetylase PdaC
MRKHLIALSAVALWSSTSTICSTFAKPETKITQEAPSSSVKLDKLKWEKKSPKGYCQYQAEYPQVRDLTDAKVEASINNYIKSKLLTPDKDITQCDAEYTQASANVQAANTKDEVTYQVGFNQRDLLSIEYSGISYSPGSVYGRPAQGVTVNVKTGKVYSYRDLFKPGSNYVSKMNKLIYKKLKTPNQKGSDIELSKEESENIANQFKSDSKLSSKNERNDYSFSLHGDTLVILDLFNTNALRAVQVKVQPSEIKDLVNSKGPLHQISNQ